MKTALITGGAGFFGGVLAKHLLEKGWQCVSIDLQKDSFAHPHYTAIQGDIRDASTVDQAFGTHKVDAVFHCAAMLAHAVQDKNMLWTSNVNGTRVVAEAAKKHGVQKLIFISSNCLWGESIGRPIREDDTPNPVEIYGKSKLEAEKILHTFENDMSVVIIRSTTIIDSGRLGLLAILFAFIDEGKKVWVVGGGNNTYQFVYAKDLADACEKAAVSGVSGTFGIGSDNVKSFKEVYEAVIKKAGSKSRVATLPRGFTLFGMKVAYALGLSPLGPYQYKMIAESFAFDTTKIKRELHWQPTLTNEDMLWKAYEYYHQHKSELRVGDDVSAHKQPAKMGIIRVLKWLS